MINFDMLLNGYINTDEFWDMTSDEIYENSKVKIEYETLVSLINSLNLEFEPSDTIMCQINSAMNEAIRVAYKKGVQDGMGLVLKLF